MRPSLFSRARAAGPALFLALVLLAPAAAHAYLLTSADDDQTNNFIILYSLGYYLSLDPTQAITVFEEADFHDMAPREPVWISTHGNSRAIGGKTSGDLLNLFTTKHLPATTPTVYLFGCEAGIGGANSLTMRLGESMQAGWPGIQTVGPKGCLIADASLRQSNSSRVVLPANVGAVGVIQDRLKAHYQPQQALDTLVGDFQRRYGRYPTLRERAAMALRTPAIINFYRDLLAQCQQQGLIQAPDTGFCTAPGGQC